MIQATAELHHLSSARQARTADDDSGRALVSLRNIGFTYAGATRAIGDLSFDLMPGETLSVVGPSGCGKSTLLRIIAGLRQPTDGAILRDDGKRARHACSMVFQEDTLGSIQPGKLADLVVLDRDYLTIPADQIKDIRPVMTMIGGRIAYDGGTLSSTR